MCHRLGGGRALLKRETMLRLETNLSLERKIVVILNNDL
jgi:hypothetical protein